MAEKFPNLEKEITIQVQRLLGLQTDSIRNESPQVIL
jgi:hypothetical protein